MLNLRKLNVVRLLIFLLIGLLMLVSLEQLDPNLSEKSFVSGSSTPIPVYPIPTPKIIIIPTPTPESTPEPETPEPTPEPETPEPTPESGTGLDPIVIGGIVIGIVVAVVVVLLVYRFLKKPKVSKPAKLILTAEPANLVADGKSQSVLTLQLLDSKGNPMPAPTDIQVLISAEKGRLVNPSVVIPKGKDMEKTIIVSSKESGTVPVSAEAERLKAITISLNFMEKKRYCMHCGAFMPSKAKACPNCGKTPPAGVDTKVCHNCKSVIPSLAKFCSECGAGQKQ